MAAVVAAAAVAVAAPQLAAARLLSKGVLHQQVLTAEAAASRMILAGAKEEKVGFTAAWLGGDAAGCACVEMGRR